VYLAIMHICYIVTSERNGSETGIIDDSFHQFGIAPFFWETITLFIMHFDL